MRQSATAGIAKLGETPAPEEIQEREKALAAAIQSQRAGAKPGDLFGNAQKPIVATVRADWSKRSAAQRAALLSEVGRIPAPMVNTVYPPGVPLATFPPDLLTALPELPEPVEYRFAGRHLILLDSEASLVLDVVPAVLDGPTSASAGSGAASKPGP